tara:strand:+ start:1315 stop:1512 length:198 start_codon:yes stop_codon:yes gene_type:complete
MSSIEETEQFFDACETGKGREACQQYCQPRMDADYVYIIEFEGEEIRHMTKVWNNVVSLKQLGWM